MDPGTPTASFVGVKSNNMPGVGPQFPAVPPGPVGSQARVSFLKEVQVFNEKPNYYFAF